LEEIRWREANVPLICQAINTVYKVPTPTPLDNKIMLTPSMMENYYWIIHQLSATFLYYDIRQREAIISPPQQIRKGLVCCQAIILSTKSPPATRQQNNVNHRHDEKLLLNHTSTVSYIFIRWMEAVLPPYPHPQQFRKRLSKQ
jgi:hypothetical protein